MGFRVILTEETDWLGGQLTAQAVPPDENRWIETEGCTLSYRKLREGIRAYYRRNYPMTEQAALKTALNPGMGNVSRLCHEPRVAVAVINEMLAPYQAALLIDVRLNTRPLAVEMHGDIAQAVTFEDLRTGDQETIQAAYILDATELGDLLPLAQMEYVTGAESQAQTGEPHALPGAADPLDQQGISYCFALDYLPDEDHTIERPRDYDFWRTYQPPFWPNPLLSWTYPEPITLKPITQPIFDGDTDLEDTPGLWHYRRIFYRRYYHPGRFNSDITLVNWPQMDYFVGPIIGVSPEERERHLENARQLSFSLLYWMQTEAPRSDGGQGFPGLRLRKDVLDTRDGLAKMAYIRESRRIRAEFTVTEQHVGYDARAGLQGAAVFSDSVGVGSYRIDLHPSTSGRNYVDISNWPFQIPLGALIPVRVENLLPACKNLGVTHITNGCFREHPVEWNIGEAAGALAAWCLERKCLPRQVRSQPAQLSAFQSYLANHLGFQLAWSETARLTPLTSW
jgi:hypothetical protein